MGTKRKTKKQNKNNDKKKPTPKKKRTNQPHTHKKENKKRGKSYCHEFFPPLPFVASSDEDMAPWQTVGEALLQQTLPKSARRGIKGFVCVYWWHGNILSLIFHSVKDYSSLFVLQFCHQPNKRSTDKKCHMSFLGFISLSQPIIFCRSSAGTGHIFLFSILSWGKTLKPKNRKIWYYCDLKPNLNSLNRINNFLFVNPFIEEGQL